MNNLLIHAMLQTPLYGRALQSRSAAATDFTERTDSPRNAKSGDTEDLDPPSDWGDRAYSFLSPPSDCESPLTTLILPPIRGTIPTEPQSGHPPSPSANPTDHILVVPALAGGPLPMGNSASAVLSSTQTLTQVADSAADVPSLPGPLRPPGLLLMPLRYASSIQTPRWPPPTEPLVTHSTPSLDPLPAHGHAFPPPPAPAPLRRTGRFRLTPLFHHVRFQGLEDESSFTASTVPAAIPATTTTTPRDPSASVEMETRARTFP
jgi:hypothetical protein